jgi:hypothetical protein
MAWLIWLALASLSFGQAQKQGEEEIPPLVPGDARGVLHEGSVHAFDALPGAVGPSATKAIGEVRSWCERTGKIAALDAEQRFLLVLDPKERRALRRHEAAIETAAWFDARLPPPSQDDAAKERDLPTAIVHLVRDEAEQGLLLDDIVTRQPTLKDWSKTAKKKPGFVLYEPLLIAVLVKPKGVARWNAEHDMANRLAQLLVERRFGPQPDWLALGVGWCAEWRIDAEIHCFPNRTDAVQRAEHGAWGNEIRRECAKRIDEDGSVAPLLPLELSACRRGAWHAAGSRRAFGMASYLLAQPPQDVSDALHDLRRAREALARKTTPPVPDDLELPPDEIDAVIGKRLGEDWRVKATSWIAAGHIPQSKSVARDDR